MSTTHATLPMPEFQIVRMRIIGRSASDPSRLSSRFAQPQGEQQKSMSTPDFFHLWFFQNYIGGLPPKKWTNNATKMAL